MEERNDKELIEVYEALTSGTKKIIKLMKNNQLAWSMVILQSFIIVLLIIANY